MNVEKRTGNKYYIDFLKAAGAAVIMVYHYRNVGLWDPSWPADAGLPLAGAFGAAYQYGYLAVELFYILSGFGFVQKYLFSEKNGISFWKFLGGRLAKFYPVFFITTILSVILQYAAYFTTGSFCIRLDKLTLVDVFLSIAMLQCGIFDTRLPFNVPTWFMTPLLICYILFWSLFLRPNRKENNRAAWLLSAALAGIGLAVLWLGWNTAILNERMMRGIYSFFFGVLLGGFCAFFNKRRRTTAICGIMIICLSVIMMRGKQDKNLYLFSVPFFSSFILLMEDIRIDHILSLNPLRLLYMPLAKLSYPLFCSHYVALIGIVYLGRFVSLSKYYGSLEFFALYCVLSVGLAILAQKTGDYFMRKSMN